MFSIGSARADDESYGWGMMHGGYGGMGMGGYGMMGGYGGYGMMGPGMMGGGYGGMGMGGYGMMGGYGGYGMMGPGMMGYGGMLNLSQAQRDKIEAIQQNMRKSHFAMMESMIKEREKLAELYNQEYPSPSKVGAVYGRIFAIQRQMIESSISAHNQMNKVLTKEQREQIQQWHRGMWGGGYGPRGRMGDPDEMRRGPGMMR
ncbi:MAG: Spy/CpxP family protein refolding chaperone [Acidiferrobacterales bacterium]